jgi:hypothetical protein
MARSDAFIYRQWWKHPFRVLEHRRERARRGFSRYDVWSLDGYLAQVIADSLRELRLNGHGYPGTFNNQDEWSKVLLGIETPLRIWAETHHDMDLDEEDRWMERCHESLKLLNEYFFGLWD